MRTLNVGAVALLLGAAPTTSVSEGLRLKNPTIIDAAALALYPWAEPKNFERVSDDSVKFALFGRIDTEFRKVPGKSCAFQTVAIDTGKVTTQFDFSRLSSDYINRPGDGFMGGKIRLLGDNIFCLRVSGEISCYGAHDLAVGGINGARRVIKAVSFIQKNYCPPID